jgi:hypothetical protein
MRYDADTELLAKFEQTKDNHIFSHIREWKHRKILIKVKIPPNLFLERFLKSLVSFISKYIANFSVFSKEEAIMKSQYLELIYSQSGMLYEILPDAPRSTLDKAKQKSGPHANGIVGSTQSKSMDMLSNHLQQLSIQQTMSN